MHGLRSNHHSIQKPGAQRNEDDCDHKDDDDDDKDGDDVDEEGEVYYEDAMMMMMMMTRRRMLMMIKRSREKGEDGWLVGSFRPTADSSNFSRFKCCYHAYSEGSILSW